MPVLARSETAAALERVLSSRSFARAGQLRRLLRYVVEATLDGRASTLKETTIGVDVFDLSTDFDPKSDPVVRMAMRRLRDRLQKYYVCEGTAERILISLEPGSYIPRFVPRDDAPRHRVPIAVLPFESLEQGAKQQNCGALLREALVSRLAENKTFRLIGNEAPESFWANSDLGSIGRKLQVRFIVRAACVESDQTIRVCTELFCPQTERSVWSGNHEQDASREIWTVQNDIAVDLERQALAADGQASPPPEPYAEAGVYRLILQGRHYLLQNNVESIRKAQQCFLTVLGKRPDSDKAWAALSISYTLMGLYHMEPSASTWQKAEAAAKKALALSPLGPEAHIATGLFVVFHRFDPLSAEKHFRRAIEANAGDSIAPMIHAMTCLAPLSKLDEAEDELETVLANDPINPKALQLMAVILYFQRRYETAIEVGHSALDISPASAVASLIVAACYERLGQKEEALKYYRKCDELMPFMRTLRWSMVVAAAFKGRSKWVRPTVLAIAKLLQSSSRVPAAMLSDLLIRIGEQELAIRWMERAFRERSFRSLFLGVDPAFDAIRTDPRCLRLLEQLGGAGRCEMPSPLAKES